MNSKKLKRDINLFESIFKDKSRAAVDTRKLINNSIRILVIVLIIALVRYMGHYLFLKISTAAVESANETLKAENDFDQIAKNKALAQELQVGNDNLKAQLETFRTSEQLHMEDIKNIANEQPVDIIMTSFKYNDGVLTFECSGSDELTGADFANLLRNSKHFKNVKYEGFSKRESNYVFTISLEIDKEAEQNG